MEYRVVTVEYFLERMRLSELMTITDTLEYIDRGEWDRTRIACLISAQKASRKRLKMKDIFELPWDRDKTELPDAEEMKQIITQQKAIEALLNKE